MNGNYTELDYVVNQIGFWSRIINIHICLSHDGYEDVFHTEILIHFCTVHTQDTVGSELGGGLIYSICRKILWEFFELWSPFLEIHTYESYSQ